MMKTKPNTAAIREAAGEAQKLVKMFNAVRVVSEAFDAMVSMDNTTTEIEQRLAAAQSEEVLLKDRFQKMADSADKKANGIINEATNKALFIVEQANNHAAECMKKLEADRDGLAVEVDQLTSSRIVLVEQNRSYKGEFDEMVKRIADKSDELRGLEDRIAAARATISNMLSNSGG